jgi:uncharacterized damage-inducible protein DinB
MIAKPVLADAPKYFHHYINLVDENDLTTALLESQKTTAALINSIQEEKANFRYAESKWSIKEVLQHIIDSERIFAYRALRFSRRDATPLSGFDENHYVPNANTSDRTIKNILEEYQTVRAASVSLYQYMNDEMLDFKASANGVENTARAMGWMIVGHNLHHLNVIKERYLNQ